ncbi:hypothetical protein SAMD00023353_4200720 [Rosellinia necatrix]|uniref:Uncharacterized protein n=1 Tax=Rosellinia necatrix TaxID=77044 RepID=A0A1S8A9A2_ROSNE|nr:hypothetical protein SAMD00023353_4200720 [Rosellinia necatrix]
MEFHLTTCPRTEGTGRQAGRQAGRQITSSHASSNDVPPAAESIFYLRLIKVTSRATPQETPYRRPIRRLRPSNGSVVIESSPHETMGFSRV